MNQPKITIPKRIALSLTWVYGKFHRLISWVTGRLRLPMTTQIYYAMRHREGTSIKGRVLRIQHWRKPRVDDHVLVNLWQMMKLWCSPQRPNTLVRAISGDHAVEQRSDSRGYFDLVLPPECPEGEDIIIQLPRSKKSELVTVEPKTPRPNSRCLVISDIDDTVMISHVARVLTMIGVTIFGNALTRQIFPGTPELLQSLKHGTSGIESERNPFAYVTSSPFNIHGLIQLIFKENRIPRGAFFMTAWGIDREKWFMKSHLEHKLEAIREAMVWFPDRPAILFGDSGQHDTLAYKQIVEEFPGRVAYVLIRKVSDKSRISELEEKVNEDGEVDVPFAFFKDSLEAATLLYQSGWITGSQLKRIDEAFEEQSKNPLAELLHPKQKK